VLLHAMHFFVLQLEACSLPLFSMRRLLPWRFLLVNAENQLVFQRKPFFQRLHQQGNPFR